MLVLLGRLYIGAHDLAKAIEALEKAYAIEPENRGVLLDLGLLYEETGQPALALACFYKLLPGHEDDFAVQDKVGQLLITTGRYKEALEHYKRMQTRFKGASELRVRIALAYYELQDYEKATEELKGYLEDKPKDDEARYLLANTLAQAGNASEAIEELQKIPEDSAVYIEALTLKAYLYSQQGLFQQAIRALERALKTQKDNPNLWALLGEIHANVKQYDRAIAALQHANDLDPKNKSHLLSLAFYYDKHGQLGKAEVLVRGYLQTNPNDPDALNFLGYSFAERGIRLDEALSLLTRALALKPDAAYIADSLGWAYFKLGRIEEAIAQLERALRLEPNDPVILEHMGDAYLVHNNPDKALQCYKKALENKPESPEAIEEKIRSILNQPSL
jgi:tetratricopeptide (TPR) repeat protein